MYLTEPWGCTCSMQLHLNLAAHALFSGGQSVSLSDGSCIRLAHSSYRSYNAHTNTCTCVRTHTHCPLPLKADQKFSKMGLTLSSPKSPLHSHGKPFKYKDITQHLHTSHVMTSRNIICYHGMQKVGWGCISLQRSSP